MSTRQRSASSPPQKISRLISLAILPLIFYFFYLYQLLFAPHLLVIWLQNSDEMRATGGFLGSVAWVESRGVFPKVAKLRDIYELGGNIRTYIEPPPAVKAYLSGGGSLRLQDINWDRDFAVSAARFNDFLSLSNEENSLPPGKKADLIVAVNLSLIENLFDKIGGVPISADYPTNSNTLSPKNPTSNNPAATTSISTNSTPVNLNSAAAASKQKQLTNTNIASSSTTTTASTQLLITGENFADLARARRPRQDQRDFPKMDLLKLAARALAKKLQSLPLGEKISLLPWFWQQAKSREVQIFSPHALLQAIFASAKIAGHTTNHKNRGDIYLIDSNVGINKNNRYVTRIHNLELPSAANTNSASNSATLYLTWQNHCDPSFFADNPTTISARPRTSQNTPNANNSAISNSNILSPNNTQTPNTLNISSSPSTIACNYVNYFRLLLDSDTTLQNISVTAPTLTTSPLVSATNSPSTTHVLETFTPPLDIRQITDSQNHAWQEVGFLIIVQPNSSVSAQITLTSKNSAWQVN